MKNYLGYLKAYNKERKKYHYLLNLEPKEYSNFLKKEYKERTGEELNIDSPKKYTEKMQYAKIHLNSNKKSTLSDKYAVREWVANKIGQEYLIPLLGVWDNAYKIDFRKLPKQFVLKLNNGAGTNIIVKDKTKLNKMAAKFRLTKWMHHKFAFAGDIQPHYSQIKSKIIAEEFIEDEAGDLSDYKFLCFDGKPYYVWEDIGRFGKHYRNIYDMEWISQPWTINASIPKTPYNVDKPQNFEEMKKIAGILSEGFSHVRVDLYNVDGKIYFGEMTFTSSGGYSLVVPEEYNYKLGELWNLEYESEKGTDI